MVDGLWERVAKEWSLAMEMKRNVDDLNEKMQAIENLGQEVAGLNIKMIESFGGVIEGIPAEACASDIFSWMSDKFATLSDFVSKVGDFAALCGVRNLLCMEESLGCNHLEEFGRKSYKFSSPGELGEPWKLVKLVSGRYMSEFWARFGQDHARTLVEAHWAVASKAKKLLPKENVAGSSQAAPGAVVPCGDVAQEAVPLKGLGKASMDVVVTPEAKK